MELLDLGNLTEEERSIILGVIRRDDELRRKQENLIGQVKQEIHNLRKNSVLRSGDDLSKICARCKTPFRLVTKTGEVCPSCRFRVCKNCRDTLLTGGWLCSLCFKENQLRWLTGDWMTKGKEKGIRPRYSSGTDLIRASLRVKRPTGRFSTDYTDYDSKDNGVAGGVDEKTAINKGSLGGAEERAGHNNPSRARQDSHCSTDSADRKPLSNLLDSFRSGLGGSSDDHADGRGGAGALGGAGGAVVVQHVSCRRRRDSNSSSNSDSDSQLENSRKGYSETNGTAREPKRDAGARFGNRGEQKSPAHSLDRRSGGGNDARAGSQSHFQKSEVPADSVKSLERRRGKEGAQRVSEASKQTRKSELPQAVRTADSRQRKEAVTTRPVIRQNTSDGERRSSGCSFTSSEWGEVTPTDNGPGCSSQPSMDRKEEVGSALGQSSGYVSSSRKSLDMTENSLNNSHSPQLNQDSPSPSKCKSSPSKLPIRSRQNSRDSCHQDPSHTETPHLTSNAQAEAQIQNRNNIKARTTQGHVRRQSSGRSETLSTCSAKTASPVTKMRLLDLASSRALERDGDDSVKSWSGGSEDTMSLGMSCSGIPVSPDAPVFQKVHYKRQKGCEGVQDDDHTEVAELSHQVEKAETDEEVTGMNITLCVTDADTNTIDNVPRQENNSRIQDDTAEHGPSLKSMPADDTSHAEAICDVEMAPSSGTDSLAADEMAVMTSHLEDTPTDNDNSKHEESKETQVQETDTNSVTENTEPSTESQTHVSQIEEQNAELLKMRSPSHQVPDALLHHLQAEEDMTLSSIPEETELEGSGSQMNRQNMSDDQVLRAMPVQEHGAKGMNDDTNIQSCVEPASSPQHSQIEQENSEKGPHGHGSVPRVCVTAHETEGRYAPTLNQSRQSDGDHTGASDLSDHGHGSPRRSQSNNSTPQKSSHLSIPSVVATSNAGSYDERSMGDDDDDDNIDELFAKYRSGSRLGVSRSSIGDSRESLASVYSDAGEINYGRIPVSGEITFGLDYDHKLSALKINIKGCRDLAPVDTKHNRSDPYVKVYLLPDKTRSGKRKSKIKKHTLNPVFNETLTYNISQGELENRTLWVAVWHSDRFGRNDFLGEVIIPMDMYRFEDPTPCTYTLQARMPDTMNEEAMQYKGDLIVSLKYITPDHMEEKKSKSKSKKSKQAAELQGELHVMIKSAKNLTAARSNGTSDPFVKGYLLPDRGRTGKQKTPVVKNSVNPTWNHTLVFDNVNAMELGDRSLELTVWDHEKLGTNEFLGGARLNMGRGVVKGEQQVDWMDARGQESIAWQSMMAQPNAWTEAKLPLRASMGKATTKK